MSLRLAVVVLLLISTGMAENRAAKPVDCSQLLTWMVAGIPNQRLSRLVAERGIRFHVGQSSAEFFASAGAGSDLLSEMRKPGAFASGTQSSECPTELVQAAELVHQQHYDSAEAIMRRALAADPDNVDVHMALGYLRMQQDDVDEAFDDYSDAKDLDATFPEIHNGLSYVFYRSNDGENSIAEARTALSIDPQNAEAYRYLGLGLYADGNFAAALHAFQESLTHDSKRAETYYDLGLAQSADKKLTAAAQSYRSAIRLNPELLEARTKLELVLRELAPKRAAMGEEAKSTPDPKAVQ
ncbi:MAG: tetratricopeptide repeat protein [Acidobacteriaceae bacterium]|nr:tetratricopeptide repeat protein [Acidobacteriaceae bacterium]